MRNFNIQLLICYVLLISTAYALNFPYELKIKENVNHYPLNRSVFTLDINFLLKDNLYFVLKDPENGIISYTQNGLFTLRDRYYYQGKSRLQGYPVPSDITENSCTFDDVILPPYAIPSNATSLISIAVNLNANSMVIAEDFDPRNSSSYHYHTSLDIYDSFGKPHPFSVYFSRVEDSRWLVNIMIDSERIGLGTADFSNAGILESTSRLDSMFFNPINGANSPQIIKLQLDGSTQFANESKTNSYYQDGTDSGDIVEDSVDSNGYITATYSNGKSMILSKIAVVKR